MQRLILHIDFDSFFASVEQQYNPKLRGAAVGVTATNGRTCIIASSREAKRLGIGTGSRTFDAKRICPQIVFVPADFVKYWEISQKFIAICKDYTPYLEVFSIDELFMDVTKTAHLFGGVELLIAAIKKRIAREVGPYITVSIGVSYNKLLAKLGSGLKKPNGVVFITKDNIDEVYSQAKLTDMCGIGERLKVRLHMMGIYTLFHLRNTPLSALVAEFGNVQGHILKNIGRGFDASEVISYTNMPTVKSVGRNHCLAHNEYDKRKVLQNVYELCEEVGIKLRRINKKARTLGISLRGDKNLWERKTYSQYFDTGKDIFERGMQLFGKNVLQDGYVRQISVWVANLADSQSLPHSLFDITGKKERLVKAVDRINERFGDHTIRNGYLLYADKLTTVPNGYMADKYERIKLAQNASLS